jgi:energy-coupling factor transport system permease protein
MTNKTLSTPLEESGYRSGDSPLHRTAPRTKILLALVLLAVAGTGGGCALFSIALVCQLGLWISGASLSASWQRLGSFRVLLFILGGAPLFLSPGTPLQLWGEVLLPVTIEGLECGVLVVSRLVLMIWVSMILVQTTRPETLLDALMVTGPGWSSPGKRFQEILVVGVLAFQALPGLFAEAQTEVTKGLGQERHRPGANRFDKVCAAVEILIEWMVSVLSDSERLPRNLKRRQ